MLSKSSKNISSIFIINLHESKDRRSYMEVLCQQHGLHPIFIKAVVGKSLTTSDIDSCSNHYRAENLFGRKLLLGELGCALSHKKIYQKIINDNIPHALILEDDITISDNIHKAIDGIEECFVPWELVLLGHHKDITRGISSPISIWDKHDITSKFTLNRLASFGFGTYGYLISKEGARKLLDELDTIYQPIDHYTSDSNIINVYALCPPIISVNTNFETLIDNNNVRQKNNDRLSVILLKKIGVINIAIKTKSFLKKIKPIKRYK